MVCCVRPNIRWKYQQDPREAAYVTKSGFFFIISNKPILVFMTTGEKLPLCYYWMANARSKEFLQLRNNKPFYWICTNITWIRLIWCGTKKIISFNNRVCHVLTHCKVSDYRGIYLVFLCPLILSISRKILFDKEEELHIDGAVLISLV